MLEESWVNSPINLAVKVDIDVWQFVCVGMKNYRDRNPPLIPVIRIVEINSPANYPRTWFGQRGPWRFFWVSFSHTDVV